MYNEDGKEANVLSFEQLLMKRLERAFDALDAGQGQMFDELLEEMEMLFQLKPIIYEQLMKYKGSLSKNLVLLADHVSKLAQSARNEIQRRVFYEGEVEALEWEARKDYLNKIIMVMGANQMIPMETPEPAVLESVDEKVEKKIPEEKKAPKLSIPIKSKDEFEA